ncbi:MAG: NADPH-dependent F420 reductase [Pseudorhodoplanes sp.]|nr:NADPH-dependent F420 reductase [Pseudorhodoplanes sp.]
MRIAIVGSGKVGRALGNAWKAAGHGVTYAMREAAGDKAKALAAEGFGVAGPSEAAREAEVVLLAVPWGEIPAVIDALGPLDGRVLVDATNPLTPDRDLALGFDDSAGETVGLLAQGARVVKAFNTTGADNMQKARDFPVKPAMFVAGDDADAKKIVQTLAEEIGFEAIDAGPLKASRYLEPMAMQWIKLAYAGAGTQFAFALTRR